MANRLGCYPLNLSLHLEINSRRFLELNLAKDVPRVSARRPPSSTPRPLALPWRPMAKPAPSTALTASSCFLATQNWAFYISTLQKSWTGNNHWTRQYPSPHLLQMAFRSCQSETWGQPWGQHTFYHSSPGFQTAPWGFESGPSLNWVCWWTGPPLGLRARPVVGPGAEPPLLLVTGLLAGCLLPQSQQLTPELA